MRILGKNEKALQVKGPGEAMKNRINTASNIFPLKAYKNYSCETFQRPNSQMEASIKIIA
jgi:hypothetical protein